MKLSIIYDFYTLQLPKYKGFKSINGGLKIPRGCNCIKIGNQCHSRKQWLGKLEIAIQAFFLP